MRAYENYVRHSESRYYVKNEKGATQVAEVIRELEIDTLAISTPNDISQYVVDQMVLEGFSLYQKTIIDDMSYLVLCK